MTPMICARCGAPLPADVALAFVTCAYCDTTPARTGVTMTIVERAAPAHATAERPLTPRQAFEKDVAQSVDSGADRYDAIDQAALRHLGEVEHSYAIARVTLAMAEEFSREHGVTLDGNALGRLAAGYLTALVELRSCKSTDLDLPFLAATSTGSQHFLKRLTPAVIAQLASGDEAARGPGDQIPQHIGAPAHGAPPSHAKKKWYWPFGS